MSSRQVSSDGISETTIDNRTSSSDKGEGIEASKSVTINLSANRKQESPMVYLSNWDETRKSIVYDQIFYDKYILLTNKDAIKHCQGNSIIARTWWIFFISSPCQRQCELLPLLGVRRLVR